MKKLLAIFLTILLVVPSVGLATESTVPTMLTAIPTSISLAEKEFASIRYTTNLGAAYGVTASSSNSAVAVVTGSSDPLTVTAIGGGTATITIKLNDNPSVTATCVVTVQASPTVIIPGATAKTLEIGQTYKLTAAIGNGYYDKPFRYSSDNWDVASVSTDGLITAKAPGKARIFVATQNGSAEASCEVTVNALPNVSVSHNASSMSLGSTMTFTAKDSSGNVIPGASLGSSNSEIIAVSGSTLTAKRAGSATITATYNGESASKTVTVNAAPTTISISPSPVTLSFNQSVQLVPSITAGTTTNFTYGMTDMSPAWCFSLTSTGLITASAGLAGTGKVVVTTLNGLSATVNVTITDKTVATPTPPPTDKPTDTPSEPLTPGSFYAKVTTKSGSLNLRAWRAADATIYRTIPQNAWIVVTEKGSVWCKTTYLGTTGYVMTQYLTFSAATDTPTTAPTETTVPGDYNARVATKSGSLNLRAAAKDNADVLTTIPQNAWIKVTERGTNWCKTTYNGITGYVMTKFLSFTGTVTDTPTTSPTDTPVSGSFDAKVTTKSGGLNLRELATKDSKALLSIPQNAWIVVTERGAAWCKTTYNGITGYVMTSFLTFGTKPSDTPTSKPTVDPSDPPVYGSFDAKVTTKSGGLNLREDRTKDSRSLISIPQNTWIVVTEKGASWCKTSYKGKTGFVMTSFLTFGTQPTTPTDTPTDKPTDKPDTGDGLTPGAFSAKVTTVRGSLNLRKEMKSNATIIDQIPQNTWITVTGRGTTWCRTTYNGLTGYVMTSYLTFGAKPTDTPTDKPTDAPTDKPTDPTTPVSLKAKVTTSGGDLNLRESASEVTKFIARIPNGTEITVTERGATWCKATYAGKTGYVRTMYLRFLSK